MKKPELFTAKPHDHLELMRMHETERLTQEQVIGQLLVWSRLQHEALLACERKLEEQEGYIADLAALLADGKEGKQDEDRGGEDKA